MKILFVVSNLKVGGGAENYVSLLSEKVSTHYNVEILTYYKFKQEYPVNQKRFNFNYSYSNNPIIKIWRLLFLFPYMTYKFLKQREYDYVISNSEDANVVTLIYKALLSKPNKSKFCAIIHNNLDLGIYKYTQFLLKKADLLFTVSKSLTKLYQKRFNFKKIYTLYNPFDLKNINTLKSEKIEKEIIDFTRNKKTLITIGRFAKQKNHALLLDIFCLLAKEDDKMRLIILGDGPFRKQINFRINKKGIKDKVLLLGIKKNVYKYLNKSDVFVLTSSWEGFGRVLIEAMSVGLPVVSNNCLAGPSEILDDKEFNELNIKEFKKAKYGYLVSYNNEKGFIKAIKDALKHKEEFKKKSITRSRDFSVEKISEEFKKILEDCEKDKNKQ